jgi:hypothetical protein
VLKSSRSGLLIVQGEELGEWHDEPLKLHGSMLEQVDASGRYECINFFLNHPRN